MNLAIIDLLDPLIRNYWKLEINEHVESLNLSLTKNENENIKEFLKRINNEGRDLEIIFITNSLLKHPVLQADINLNFQIANRLLSDLVSDLLSLIKEEGYEIEGYEIKPPAINSGDIQNSDLTEENLKKIKHSNGETELELSTPMKLECKNLVVHEKNMHRFKYKTIIFGVLALSIFLISQNFFPSGKQFQEVLEISIPVTAGIIVSLVMSGRYLVKGDKERLCLLGFNKTTLNIYQAMLSLEKYLDSEPDIKHIKKAKARLKKVVRYFEWEWGPEESFEPPLKSLKKPFIDFINYLENNFYSSFMDIYSDNEIIREKIVKRRTTLIRLIKLFQNENFNEISSIIPELKQYQPLEKPKEKTWMQKFMEHIILIKIIIIVIGSGLIIGFAIGIAHVLTLNPDSTYSDFINWTLYMAIPGIIALAVFIAKWKP